MKVRNALAATAILALPLTAQAQPIAGLYIGGGAGADIIREENATLSAGGTTRHGHLKTVMGSAVSLSLGYGLGNGFRVEMEGNFHHNNFNVTRRTQTVAGTEQNYGTMVNVLYDFVGLVPLVRPYLGVGGGYQWARESNLHINTPGMEFSARDAIKGDFVYQAIVGAALPIAGVPGLSLTADSRFTGLTGSRTYYGKVTVGPRSVPANLKLDGDYSHTFLVGFRYAF